MLDRTSDPQEAIEIAIKREREAHDFYLKHADLFENEATKKMFLFLAEEESKHEAKLQAELDSQFLKEM